MNGRIACLICSLLLLYSCTESKYKTKDLAGQWKFIKHENSKPKLDVTDPNYIPDYGFEDNFVAGYHFINEKEVSYKNGFYKNSEKGKTTYLGTLTTYRIIGDSIKIYHKTNGKWNAYKIHALTTDTLKLVAGDGYDTYAKLTYQTDTTEHYDKIVLTTSGCYGTCPVLSLSINNKGDFLFYGIKYTDTIGLYKGQISLEEFKNFEENFKQSAIKNLKDHYAASWTDDQTVSVSFIRNDTIIKSVSDYGRHAPTEFIWAYNDLSYFYMLKNLKKTNANLPFDFFGDIYFADNKHYYPMYASEVFFLFQELMMKATITNKKFTPLYFTTDYFWEYDEKLYTDGRFFQVKKGNETLVYDLGYDFIKRNDIKQRNILKE